MFKKHSKADCRQSRMLSTCYPAWTKHQVVDSKATSPRLEDMKSMRESNNAGMFDYKIEHGQTNIEHCTKGNFMIKLKIGRIVSDNAGRFWTRRNGNVVLSIIWISGGSMRKKHSKSTKGKKSTTIDFMKTSSKNNRISKISWNNTRTNNKLRGKINWSTLPLVIVLKS